ncbi:MAG: DUF1836 domain-containing protein [Coriobacteriia bacterium]|nr:DUF1836 domain-containing protein [Coriobacteriia bacterium]
MGNIRQMDSGVGDRIPPHQGFYYPRYDELPEGLLFLDGMVDLMNLVHADLSERSRHHKVVTRSIVSNYVKAGLTPPAIGKRYDRDHMALILFAVTVKLLCRTEDVMDLAAAMFPQGQVPQAHDRFAAAVNAEFAAPTTPSPDDDLYVLVARAFSATMRALTMLG